MKLDMKSIVIGLALGILLILIYGAVERRDLGVKWGLIVPADSKVLVRDKGGRAFIIDVKSARAVRVAYDTTELTAPNVQLTLSED